MLSQQEKFLLNARGGSLECHVPSLYVSTWNEGRGIMVPFISWISVLHKTFLLLCLGTGTTLLPSKRSPNLMENKKPDLQHGYSMSHAAQHCSVITIVTWGKAPFLPSAQVSHRSCVLAAWTKSFFIFKHNRKRHSQCNL